MNWLTFAVVAWVCFGLELGLKGGLRIGPSIAPSFVMSYAVFLALLAPHRTALWACLMLGLLCDLTAKIGLAGLDRSVTLVGPYTFGYLLAGQLVVTMRAMMIRKNPLTMAVLAVIASAIAGVVVVAIYSLRSMLIGDPLAIQPTAELLHRLASALYTGLLALIMSLVLIPMAPAFGLQPVQGRRYARTGP
ncbi:MAG: hypothetical protein IT436_14400 [Phycisphaerales bacterium]|nr:hypothetical protein [Phycisphaerales bacterium]